MPTYAALEVAVPTTTLTKSLTHIPLRDANRSKLAALDALADEYMALCQQYVTHFCTQSAPEKFADPLFTSPLSLRWQRVAIQQAAGIARSWRHNRADDYADFQARLARYQAQSDPTRRAPVWHEPHLPCLRTVCLQANANVAEVWEEVDDKLLTLEGGADGGHFDLWLQVATLTPRQPIYLPIKLADYHRQILLGKRLNGSVTLHRRRDGRWWLTLSYDETMELPDDDGTRPRVAVDVGIASFLFSSTGKPYGSFHGDLARRHQLDRAKRQRKAKLRACLERKGVAKLPATSSASGQRLTRHVKQSINRAINEFFADHPGHDLVIERLSVAAMRVSMRGKSRRMNAYLYASNLGHIPKQIQWGAAKRGILVEPVNPAYSSQECSRCHHTERANRPDQRTFRCAVCGHAAHADAHASLNLVRRAGDAELARCRTIEEVKALLGRRHERWRLETGWS